MKNRKILYGLAPCLLAALVLGGCGKTACGGQCVGYYNSNGQFKIGTAPQSGCDDACLPPEGASGPASDGYVIPAAFCSCK
ncbi:MAG: hypothetical protein LBR23_03070 [Spirochaetaceae bacterium]|jgi:hypothetical protein|nr:hypothetical protein [Spirochaetaceae bacterium]